MFYFVSISSSYFLVYSHRASKFPGTLLRRNRLEIRLLGLFSGRASVVWLRLDIFAFGFGCLHNNLRLTYHSKYGCQTAHEDTKREGRQEYYPKRQCPKNIGEFVFGICWYLYGVLHFCRRMGAGTNGRTPSRHRVRWTCFEWQDSPRSQIS